MKGKIMEFKEPGLNDDPKKLGEETNLEGGVEKEKLELTLKKLSEDLLDESGPYIQQLIKKAIHKVTIGNKENIQKYIEVILKDKRFSRKEKREMISKQKMKIEVLIDELSSDEREKETIRALTSGFSLSDLKGHVKYFLESEAKGILELKQGDCGSAFSSFGTAGISEKMEERLNNLNQKERDIVTEKIKNEREFYQVKMSKFDMNLVEFYETNSMFREFIEKDILGKSLNELTEREIEKLDVYKFEHNEKYNEFKEKFEEIEKIQKRFAGFRGLSEKEEKHKEEIRKEKKINK